MGSDLLRVTGLNSGMDTESVIKAYTSTASKRVQDAKDALQLNKWKQEQWGNINKKIYSFYSKTLSANRMSSAYRKQKTTTSNGALTVIPGAGAVNGVQTAKIKATASAAYLTGSEVGITDSKESLTEKLGITEGSQITLTDKKGNATTIQVGGTSDDENVKVVNNMSELADAFKSAGLNANFDEGNKRLFLSAKTTGAGNDFELSGDNETLAKLGIATQKQLDTLADSSAYSAATKIDGSSAKLELNGAVFTSDTNSFTINGSTYSINYLPVNPDEDISVTTQTDYDGVYDVVKNMLKEYNDLVNEISKIYNADSAKGYKPLTEEQRDAMSEKEIEDWENKIKSSLLRKDDSLSKVMMALTDGITSSMDIGGKTLNLASFGISTTGYFTAEENERYALHIDGNPDDELTAGNADKLKGMIAADPESVMNFFTKLSDKLYNGLYKEMGTSSLSSIYKVYNDKELKKEQTEWEKKVAEYESKLSDMEDKYYKKFAVMEKTLAKINSKQSSLGGFFGG